MKEENKCVGKKENEKTGIRLREVDKCHGKKEKIRGVGMG